MLGDSKQATSATTSLIYLTLGSLIDVWAIVYFFYLRNHAGSDVAFLYVYGFIFTGAVLFLIGLAVGRIGYSARSAEVAPTPTQQIVAAPTMLPSVSEAVATGPDSPAVQTSVVRQAPVLTAGVGLPADSFAASQKPI